MALRLTRTAARSATRLRSTRVARWQHFGCAATRYDDGGASGTLPTAARLLTTSSWNTESEGSSEHTVGAAPSIKLTSARLHAEGAAVSLQFAGGELAKFHSLWLRDHCRCPQCLHPTTLQRMVDTLSIPSDIKPTDVSLVDGGDTLQVLWSSGPGLAAASERPDGSCSAGSVTPHAVHTSTYPAAWLACNAYVYAPGAQAASPVDPRAEAPVSDGEAAAAPAACATPRKQRRPGHAAPWSAEAVATPRWQHTIAQPRGTTAAAAQPACGSDRLHGNPHRVGCCLLRGAGGARRSALLPQRALRCIHG